VYSNDVIVIPEPQRRRSVIANISRVDTLWRLSAQGAGQRQRAVKIIASSLIVGAVVSLIMFVVVPPTAYKWEVEIFDVVVLAYGLGNLISSKRVGEHYPQWLMDLGTVVTTITIALGALAYQRNPISVVILTFFIWGSINMYTLLSWKAAATHTATRLPLIVVLPWLDHLQDAALVGAVMAILVAATGVSAGMLAHQNRHQALVDPLTSCPNRRALEFLLGHEMARQTRSWFPITVAAVDLDHFKTINDNEGHEAGDRALVAVTQAWTKHLRHSDIVSRFGGDEFVIVLPDCSLAQAQTTLNRLVHIDGYSCSIGATESISGEEMDQVLRRADRAMYQAKARGKGQVVTTRGIEGVIPA
jgi:diguanylate cyclase (GGDEF)-like protein